MIDSKNISLFIKYPQSKLDEMQEKKVLKIESIGLYITVIILMLSTLIQMLSNADTTQYIVEFGTFLGLCFYMIVSFLKIGVWDRRSRASNKNIIFMSLAAGIAVGIFVCISAMRYEPIYSIIFDCLIFSGLTFIACILEMLILRKIYRIRRQKLDSGAEYQELAAKVGVTVQTLKAIEDGTYNPSIDLCRKICRATGKTLDELFWKEET